MKTGQWPDKTMFILEVRASSSEGSINKGGHFQSNLVVVEASVKDEARFPGKWAYFDFGRDMKTQVAALPRPSAAMHATPSNAAVDNTFVQFYPTHARSGQAHGNTEAGIRQRHIRPLTDMFLTSAT